MRTFLLFSAQSLLIAGLSSPLISHADEQEANKNFSPYAGRDYPTQVYFGDTHHHTANSADAFMGGDRLSPEQAYRFALGEEVVSSTGVPAKLSRPLDFLVISDHAEAMGVMYEVYNSNPAYMENETLVRFKEGMHEGGLAAAKVTAEIVVRQTNGTLPGPLTDPVVSGPVMKSVWHAYTETAEKFNNPGIFTAMIGYEWTSVPGGNNLHRNILFRGNKDKADQILPFTSWQSEDPEKLWEWMAAYEKKTGGSVLAIPHNANLSNGRMFEVETFAGKPLTADYAQRRQRWEVLQEMIQTKGASETHPGLAPNDEFADYGMDGWEYGNLTLTVSPETPEMRPTTYLREGLKRGLEQESKLGTNPFKFGFIGGTDVHTSLTAVEEDNFYGKIVILEPSPHRWNHVAKKGFDKIRYGWIYMAAGYAGVWATENTRTALWDAMKRKEVYATSGSRMTVRFFGGWEYQSADANTRQLARVGYAKGVPMGGDLSGADRKDRKAPTFLVAAMKDPMFGNLDRIQIIKGWLDEDGQSHEKIYDIAWADTERRSIGADGKLTAVGNTVDVTDATWTNSIGDPDLTGWWTDPDFNPAEPAFYYTRILEIPTPTWQAYDQVRFGLKMTDDVPMSHQERAWSSPIWYTP